ncbi:hypothetical protein WJX72_011113 [[Myrmecia] bisecta]|uniref:HMA domain-containing protein n=1 Tax=[Myrmecia] bisecta TaxID=41462 RepID=A0AAW1PXV6_9CHLO
MVCDGCSSRVSNALKEMDGVRSVTVDLKSGIATVEVEAVDQLDAAYNQLPRMCDAIKELGFEAEAYFSEY